VAVVPLVVAALVPLLPRRARAIAVGGLGVVFAGAAILPTMDSAMRLFVNPARELTPVVACAGAVILALTALGRRPASRRVDLVALLVFVAAFGSLVQFPFAAPIYFFYAFALVALAVLAVLSELGLSRQPLMALVAASFLIVGLFHLQQTGRSYARAL